MRACNFAFESNHRTNVMAETPELTEADLTALLQTTQRFARQTLAAEVAVPQTAMTPERARALVNQLVQLGVLNAGPEPALGLWDDAHDPLQRVLGQKTLHALAGCSPGFAYQVHLQGLANLMARGRLMAPGEDLISFEGWLGMGGRALPAALTDKPLSPPHAAQMADCWSEPTPQKPRYLHALPDWTSLWLPTWQTQGAWRWHRFARSDLVVEVCGHPHGFDELVLQKLCLRTPGLRPDEGLTSNAQASQQFIELSACYGIGLLAIAAGAASRALLIARDYSELRRQGGVLIKEHDAVAQLLGKARQILGLTESAMTSLTTGPLNLALLIEVWRMRATLHPMLCTVASNAMQVLGGIGYMRDQGVEKLLRDCNQLRLLGGSPSELTLCSAAWESSV